MQFQVTDWVLLLFGTAKKFDIGQIKLKATTPQGIFFEASCPTLMFNRAEKKPFTLYWAVELLKSAGRPAEREKLAELHGIANPRADVSESSLRILKAEIMSLCGDGSTKFEKKFVELYFDRLLEEHRWVKKYHTRDEAYVNARVNTLFKALLPIPQAQFYCHDPLQPRTFIPENNFRVDFAFWTGASFIAVEIDGSEPDGYAADVRRDRLLRRAGIDVIHILNTEIVEHPNTIIRALLPREVLEDPNRDQCSGPDLFEDDIPF